MNKLFITLLLSCSLNAFALCPAGPNDGTPGEVLKAGESITVDILGLDRILTINGSDDGLRIEKNPTYDDEGNFLYGSGGYSVTATSGDLVLSHGCPPSG